MADSNFDEAGIEFKVMSPDDTGPVLQFLQVHFQPDDPLSRSMEMTAESAGIFNFFQADAFKKGCSIMALNPAGEIVGVRIAEVIRRNSWSQWLLEKVFKKVLPRLSRLCPKSYRHQTLKILDMMGLMFDQMEYDLWRIFGLVDKQVILSSLCLCASRTSGLRGLGSELLRRSEQLGISQGCDYAASLVTGKYSARVFRRLGYSELSELIYADFKDETGELYLKDTLDHTSCILFVKDLKQTTS